MKKYRIISICFLSFLSVYGENNRELLFRTLMGPKTSAQLYYGTTSHNFVNQYSFRHCTPYHFIPRNKYSKGLSGINFDPKKLKPGSIIFIRKPRLFFANVHPLIEHPYVLISQGDVSDRFDPDQMQYLNDNKLIAWFGIHAGEIPHPKFFPIPLGIIEQKPLYFQRKSLHEFFGYLRNNTHKEYLLYLNFRVDGFAQRDVIQERLLCKRLFMNKSFCFYAARKPIMTYFKEMASCKFVLSPRGEGIDCWRTWEALLVGSIPIVRSSQLDPLYNDLPVLVIQDWHEITEEFLNQKYKEITAKKYDLSKLYVEYWFKRIFAVRDAYLKMAHNLYKNSVII
jgi:hypothetical protein